jgi:N-acetyl-gamma-glutamyl-phosphate reductase common form
VSRGDCKIKAVVLGATGYVGGELLRLIAAHPRFELAAAVSASRSGEPVAACFPHLSATAGSSRFTSANDWVGLFARGEPLALFSASPHGTAAAQVASALDCAATKELDVHVVDSSADFRFGTASEYEAIYGIAHGASRLLGEFLCGVPEQVGATATAHVGHPGCFSTAALLAAVPLLQSGLCNDEIFVTGITGSTGSGRSPQPGTHHPERHGNLYAYKPLAHRHQPEIQSLASAACGREAVVHFVPHSGPFARGIHVTVQAKTKKSLAEQPLRDIYMAAYAKSPFVDVVDGTPRLKDVVASNYCRIGVATGNGTVAVFAVIDNLVKGAAGGAVQWMNRLWGLPETAGLTAGAPGWT